MQLILLLIIYFIKTTLLFIEVVVKPKMRSLEKFFYDFKT